MRFTDLILDPMKFTHLNKENEESKEETLPEPDETTEEK